MFMLYLCVVLVFAGAFGAIHHEERNLHQNFTDRLQEVLKNNDGKVSPKCEAHLSQYWKSLWSLDKKDMWAKKMFDAGAKIPSGLLEVPTSDLGSFDECLNIEGKTDSYEILGQYCLATIPLPTEVSQNKKHLLLLANPETRAATPDGQAGIQFATCLPNGCSAAEIQVLYSGLGMKFYEELCQTKNSKPELDAGSIATISFLGIVLWIMIASSAYDAVLHYLDKKTYHPILIAFSVVTNTKKILATSNGPNQISCLHGIRVISTMWVVLGHRYNIQSMFPVKNYLDISDWMQDQANMFIMGATVSVDTFFLIGGMVISYSYMSAVTKGVKFNILMYYIHRYIRLTPVFAVIILIQVTLFKYFGSGPLWPHVIQRDIVVTCEESWWRALLYFQNYGDNPVCVPQTWYLSVDMQLFVLSPILLIPMKRWPRFTLAATGFLTICSILTCFLTGWFFELNHNGLGNTDSPEQAVNYFKYYYFATQTRAAPWLIGIILGYIIFAVKQRKTKLEMNQFIMVAVMAASIAILCTCVFAGHDLIFGDYNKVENSLLIAFIRPAWGIALGLIIFSCVIGYGGPINWFLSLPIFEVVSKLTYTMYLSHFLVLFFISAQIRDAIRFSNGEMLYVFWGDFALTLALSFVLTLAFESPLITIEKLLFGGAKKKEAPSAPAVNEQYITKQVETA